MTHLTPNAGLENSTETEVPESHDIVSFVYFTADANMAVVAQMIDGADAPWNRCKN